ncbi:MAG: 4-hydroxythreonine-4-phosphate dehydrogenase PdxA, partial [Saccharospirillum sp.]
MRLPLAITPGEPAGIGPDLVLKQALNSHPGPWFAIADPGLLRSRAKLLGLDVTVQEIQSPDELTNHTPGTLPVLPVRLRQPCEPGVLDPANAAYVLETLDVAIDLALANRAALVTGPVHKGVINDAGIPFTGHTEYLEQKAGVDQVVMMLATEGLRVALVTTHLSLSAVPKAITVDKLKRVTTVLHAALIQDFGCRAPHILVTGLNPHAGESGHMGREEIDIIEPALEE